MDKDYVDILKLLISENSYIKIKDIFIKINYKESLRNLQKKLNALKKTFRISTRGQASTTEYILDEIQKHYPSSEFLYVYKNSHILGQLFRVNGTYRFYYDSEYLSKYSEEIPTIKLSIEPHDFDEIPAVFEDNMPEGINREIFEISCRTGDEFELLALMDDNIGDLCFSKSKEKCRIYDSIGSNYLSVLDEILDKHEKINVLDGFDIQIEENELFPENYDLSKLQLTQTHGISGFQYKKLININFERKTITTDNMAHQYIFKPFNQLKADKDSDYYFPHIALNEHLHMSFAKNELGFNVPYSAIVRHNNSSEFHYVVKRFDRYKTYKFAKSSFAAFLGLRSENKYDTTSEKMFKRIAKELISPRERMELLKYYVYSSIIVHEDLHSKNLSLIYDKKKVLLAPLYDICCTGFYDSTKGYESRLSIHGKQKNIRPNDYRGLCSILQVDFKAFRLEAKKIASIYAEMMPSYYDEIEKLGSTPFYRKKQIKKRGNSDVIFKADDKPLEFVNVLRNFHKERTAELQKLGWIE